MYESFFGLQEKPFTLTPNSRFVFLSKSHNEVYAHLLYGLETRCGFIMVTGEVGTGKTTILRTLLNRLDEKTYRIAFIFNPKLSARELLYNIASEFGISTSTQNLSDLIGVLIEFLLEEHQSGRIPVLVIDEAQNLSGEVLEQIRLLTNLETETVKLLQIVLVGQPELQQQLTDPSLRQLNQRIAVRYRLLPLNREETAAYIKHRLKVAGRPDATIFTSQALKLVYKASTGVPRMVNLICDRALLAAFASNQGSVKPEHVRQAILEVSGEHEKVSRLRKSFIWYGSSIGAFLAMVMVLSWVVIRPSESVFEKQRFSLKQSLEPKNVVNPGNDQVGPIWACNVILKTWGLDDVDSSQHPEYFDLETAMKSKGLEIMKLRGNVEQLLSFNLPFIFIQMVNDQIHYHVVTEREDASRLRVLPKLHGQQEVEITGMAELGELFAYLPWKDFAGIGSGKHTQHSGENIKHLQQLLALSGYYEPPFKGQYDPPTVLALKNFQKDHGLLSDGMIGPQTLAMLYSRAGIYELPTLR